MTCNVHVPFYRGMCQVALKWVESYSYGFRSLVNVEKIMHKTKADGLTGHRTLP